MGTGELITLNQEPPRKSVIWNCLLAASSPCIFCSREKGSLFHTLMSCTLGRSTEHRCTAQSSKKRLLVQRETPPPPSASTDWKSKRAAYWPKNARLPSHWGMFWRGVCMLSLQLCPTLWDPLDCSPPGSSVHRILQARILELVAVPFSRGSSRPSD